MSHYSAIGFPAIDSNDELNDLIRQALRTLAENEDDTEEHSSEAEPSDNYMVYSDPSGAELWLGFSDDDSLLCAEPYFSGSLHTVGIDAVFPNGYDDGTGSVQVWMNGSEWKDGEWLGGDYPFVFDTPDLASFPEQSESTSCQIRLCAFAEAADIFADEAAFEAQQDREVPLSSTFFTPLGMFQSSDGAENQAKASAWFIGTVRAAETRRNELSGNDFYCCLIETHGGTLQAVFPSDMLEHAPQTGNVISGKYWLTGRLAA